MKYLLILLLCFVGCAECEPEIPDPTPPTTPDPDIPEGATVRIIMQDGTVYYSCKDATNRECYNYPHTKVDNNYYKFANLKTRKDIYIRKDKVDRVEDIK